MSKYIRVWKELDLKDVEKHLIVMGELSSECFNCHKLGIPLRAKTCPECGVTFKYMGFRRKLQPSYLIKAKEELPDIIFIDFDDFKKTIGKRDARDILNI